MTFYKSPITIARSFTVFPNLKQPMQPFVNERGTIRFQRNAIVRAVLDAASEGRKLDLNDLAAMDFSQEDRCQFAQLIGYSLVGYHELNEVSDEHAKDATAAARAVFPDASGCRDSGCTVHCGVAREPLAQTAF